MVISFFFDFQTYTHILIYIYIYIYIYREREREREKEREREPENNLLAIHIQSTIYFLPNLTRVNIYANKIKKKNQ